MSDIFQCYFCNRLTKGVLAQWKMVKDMEYQVCPKCAKRPKRSDLKRIRDEEANNDNMSGMQATSSKGINPTDESYTMSKDSCLSEVRTEPGPNEIGGSEGVL